MGKLLLNASCNALSMIGRISFGELAADGPACEIIHGAVDEVLEVARARGINMPMERPVDQVLETARSLGSAMSSMFEDFQAGKKLEVDALNGVVVRAGKELGVPTPINATLYAAAKLAEAAR